MSIHDTRDTIGRFATKTNSEPDIGVDALREQMLADAAPEGFGELTPEDAAELFGDTRTLECVGCGRKPSELLEYSPAFTGSDLNADQCVEAEEGTLNPETGKFACTDCYIAMGMPTAPHGWTA